LGAHDFREEGPVTYCPVQFCMGQVSPAWGKVLSLKRSMITPRVSYNYIGSTL